jgi:hypothetical protein
VNDKPKTYAEVMMEPFQYRELENTIHMVVSECCSTFNTLIDVSFKPHRVHEAFQKYGSTHAYDQYAKWNAKKICIVRVIKDGKIEIEIKTIKEVIELENLDKTLLEIFSNYMSKERDGVINEYNSKRRLT